MEFHEKLQLLRKQKGLTQEELADALYVSRTAVSKWESGRGYPNIDSLKAIAKFFSVTIDELLSGDELLTIAEEDTRQKETHFRDLVFGLLDCGAALLLLLPFFGQREDSVVWSVTLFSMTEIQPYLMTAYLLVIFATVILGALTLALQNCRKRLWVQNKRILSITLSAAGVGLFIISRQSYAAIFAFTFLLIKVVMLRKQR